MISGFNGHELEAIEKRAAELRIDSADAPETLKAQRQAADYEAAIAELVGLDQQVGELLHRVVQEEASQLLPATWYGFPAFARQGEVVVYYQPAAKTGARYGLIGFQNAALLDDGEFWATAFAVLAVSDKFEAKLRGLVRKAAG